MPYCRSSAGFQDGKSQEDKITDLSPTAKKLPKEIEKHFGPLGTEIMRQSYSERLKLGHGRSSVVSPPKQEMIDMILAKRNIHHFDRKIQNAEIIKKLNENKELLKKELKEVQLQKKNFQKVHTVSSQQVGNTKSLQSRILSTMKHLPDLEVRVQNLREELYKDTERRLKPYLGESLLVGAEPYQIRDINMVRALLDELIEELMDDYLKPEPESSDIAKQLYGEKQMVAKVKEEMVSNRAIQLITEQLVLEVTLETAQQTASEVYFISSMNNT